MTRDDDAMSDDALSPHDQLLAHAAIRRKLLDYCRGIDRGDSELVASVYWADGTDDHGSFNGLGHDFARYAVERLNAHALATMHNIGDSIIDFADDGTVAWTETYVNAIHRCEDTDGEYHELFGGRYVDRFECRDGEWRIAHRALLHEWDRVEREPRAFPPGRFTAGRRDRHDPAYGRP
jgi:hypothetical protein